MGKICQTCCQCYFFDLFITPVVWYQVLPTNLVVGGEEAAGAVGAQPSDHPPSRPIPGFLTAHRKVKLGGRISLHYAEKE